MYNPGEHISIDEGVLKWRGGLSFKVYSENKPIKYGIKCYKENKLRKGDALAEDNGKVIMTICWTDQVALSTKHDASIALMLVFPNAIVLTTKSHFDVRKFIRHYEAWW